MPRFTDEELVAYVDGELAAERASEIARAEHDDPEMAQRIRAFGDSRRVLHDAFAGKVEEPVPQRLLDFIEDASGTVVPFGPRRPPRWLPMALAASLVLAIGLGAGSWYARRSAVETEDVLVSRALETLPSGVPLTARAGDKEVLPLSTLQTAAGVSCREYEMRSGPAGSAQKRRGLACRDASGHWETKATAAEDASVPSGETVYVTAAGGSDSLAAILGDAKQLSPRDEQEQINKRWKGD